MPGQCSQVASQPLSDYERVRGHRSGHHDSDLVRTRRKAISERVRRHMVAMSLARVGGRTERCGMGLRDERLPCPSATLPAPGAPDCFADMPAAFSIPGSASALSELEKRHDMREIPLD
jgi:hypothetical protein